ncbi:hypothetical protein BH09PAT4_BH09PAT4_07720 [soil metagenome]
MTGNDIVRAVKALNPPEGEYIVFGSCPMAIAGIRESSDVDMMVSPALLAKFKRLGWQQVVKGDEARPYAWDVFEAHTEWNFGAYRPTLEQLLSTATIVEGIPFVSLAEVKKWKMASGRPKDVIDVALIDKYLKQDR